MVSGLNGINKPEQSISYYTAYAPSENSDQTAQARSLISVIAGHSKDQKRLQVESEDSDQTERMRRLI